VGEVEPGGESPGGQREDRQPGPVDEAGATHHAAKNLFSCIRKSAGVAPDARTGLQFTPHGHGRGR